jgi:hypothetical protein
VAKLNKYDKQHLRNLGLTEKQIDRIYDAAIKEAAAIGSVVHNFNPDKPFSFDDYPYLKARIDKAVKSLQKGVETAIVNGVESGWTLANNKNSALCDRVFGENKNKLTKEQERRYYNNNDVAREAFLKRKTAGLNISDRVWNYTNQFKSEIEMGLDLGLRDGISATEMARDLKQYLKYPDKLFRRVRDQHGQLHLSRSAKNFHPGQGVYRSSYKNARRLASTETNMAYRTADHERYQQLEFVVGIEIKLSNNHTINGVPFTDICDDLKGKYPKTFKFTGWHPLCRCHVETILKTPEEMEADTERILNGEEPLSGSVNEVRNVPAGLKEWVADNQSRIERAEKRGTMPNFLGDNKESAKAIFSEKKYSQDFIDYVNNETRENIPKRGLVNSYEMYYQSAEKVTKYDLELLMELYFEKNPNDINGKFGGINVVTEKKYFMECIRHKNYLDHNYHNYIRINNHSFRNNGIKYNVHDELLKAMQMIREGKTLTFREEYAIENKWHEILHAKSVGLDYKSLTATQRTAMETINQFVARNSYDGFLHKLGGKAMHKEEIIKNGFGYNNEIYNLRYILSKYNISQKSLLTEFKTKILTEKYENIETELGHFLSVNGVPLIKARNCVKNLSYNDQFFSFLNS